jgi:hypothetical protein
MLALEMKCQKRKTMKFRGRGNYLQSPIGVAAVKFHPPPKKGFVNFNRARKLFQPDCGVEMLLKKLSDK